MAYTVDSDETAVSSDSALFANSAFVVFGTLRVNNQNIFECK